MASSKAIAKQQSLAEHAAECLAEQRRLRREFYERHPDLLLQASGVWKLELVD
jgi:hypothetical protein